MVTANASATCQHDKMLTFVFFFPPIENANLDATVFMLWATWSSLPCSMPTTVKGLRVALLDNAIKFQKIIVLVR